jgi:acetate kinase
MPAQTTDRGTGRRYPDLPQIACFDTAFHRDLPRGQAPAHSAAMPPVFSDASRLSYTYLMRELERIGTGAANGRRSSLTSATAAAWPPQVGADRSIRRWVHPAAGRVMNTRSGRLIPARSNTWHEPGDDRPAVYEMVHAKPGLFRRFETSLTCDLLEHEQSDPRAAEAMPCSVIRRRNGLALSAVLGG